MRNWTSYKFSSNFLTPTDGWSFTLADEDLVPSAMAGLRPGATVKLLINGLQQAAGYIDSIDRRASRSGGTEWTVEGRDVMAPLVDACMDPFKQFKPTQTLTDVVLGALGGGKRWGTENELEEDNEIGRAHV